MFAPLLDTLLYNWTLDAFPTTGRLLIKIVRPDTCFWQGGAALSKA